MNIETLQSLLVRHRDDIFRFALFLGAQSADADDLVQETFLAAFSSRSQPATEDPADWGRWLRGIARNMFLRLCRKNKLVYAAPEALVLDQDEQFWEEEFDRDRDGAFHLEALRACLERLSERDRTAIDMRYCDNRSRDEIAAHIGLSANGVKSLLRGIRTMLGECVQRHLSGDMQ